MTFEKAVDLAKKIAQEPDWHLIGVHASRGTGPGAIKTPRPPFTAYEVHAMKIHPWLTRKYPDAKLEPVVSYHRFASLRSWLKGKRQTEEDEAEHFAKAEVQA